MKLFREAFSANDLDYHEHMAGKHHKEADKHYEKMKKIFTTSDANTAKYHAHREAMENHLEAANAHMIAKKKPDHAPYAKSLSAEFGVKYG